MLSLFDEVIECVTVMILLISEWRWLRFPVPSCQIFARKSSGRTTGLKWPHNWWFFKQPDAVDGVHAAEEKFVVTWYLMMVQRRLIANQSSSDNDRVFFSIIFFFFSVETLPFLCHSKRRALSLLSRNTAWRKLGQLIDNELRIDEQSPAGDQALFRSKRRSQQGAHNF